MTRDVALASPGVRPADLDDPGPAVPDVRAPQAGRHQVDLERGERDGGAVASDLDFATLNLRAPLARSHEPESLRIPLPPAAGREDLYTSWAVNS